MSSGRALVVSVTATSENLDRFCQRLSAAVEGTPMYLASVVATGTQIFPVRLEAIGIRPTLLECEFRPRGGSVTNTMAREVLDRLPFVEVTEATVVDEHGTSAALSSGLRVAG